jgi:hypothetical protein
LSLGENSDKSKSFSEESDKVVEGCKADGR